ncbi:MAG: CcdB family protein, partial [Betaproteobacteria bacterium]|nr:CcdB family protein [Betaproteobacteria bacterium]
MARFDVYRNPNRKSRDRVPLLLDVQASLLEDLATRLVVPLV